MCWGLPFRVLSLLCPPTPHLRQAAACAEHGWLPQLPLLQGRRHLQPSLPPHVPGHDSPPEPLLHQLLSQHLPGGGPDLRPEQRRGIYTVQWGGGVELMRREPLWEIEGTVSGQQEWKRCVGGWVWGLRIPGYPRDLEEMIGLVGEWCQTLRANGASLFHRL